MRAQLKKDKAQLEQEKKESKGRGWGRGRGRGRGRKEDNPQEKAELVLPGEKPVDEQEGFSIEAVDEELEHERVAEKSDDDDKEKTEEGKVENGDSKKRRKTTVVAAKKVRKTVEKRARAPLAGENSAGAKPCEKAKDGADAEPGLNLTDVSSALTRRRRQGS